GGAGLLDLHEQVGALVLDGLEGADRLVELTPILCVLDGERERAVARAHALERSSDRRALERSAQRAGARTGDAQHALRLDEHAVKAQMHKGTARVDGPPPSCLRGSPRRV